MDTQPYLVLQADDIEPFVHPSDLGYASQHVLGAETTGRHDLLLNRGTLRPHHDLGGGSHPENDEIYYIVQGDGMCDLGGDPVTGEGGKTFRMEPGTVVFIPAGTFHRLHSTGDDGLTILTIWPQPAGTGANGIHDLRLSQWGTGFRLREGRHLVTEGQASRVVAGGRDPLVL